MDSRGMSAVAGKVLEIAIVLVFVSLLSATLYGTVVPEARTTADATVADRTLAAAIEELRRVVPASGTGTVTSTVDLPARIGGQAYSIEAQGDILVLDHPNDALDGRQALQLPHRVTRVTGRWESEARTRIEVIATDQGVLIRLVSR
jgi:hypothetical protein